MIGDQSSLNKILDYLMYSSNRQLILSDNLHRDIEGCLEVCGGCCKKVTLDYFEGTERWERFKKEFPQFVGNFVKEVIYDLVIYSDKQTENRGHFCKYLDMKTGLCTIHKARPLMCESTPLKFKYFSKRDRVYLTSETYGRKHSFRRVDGGRGAKCRLTPPSIKRKLEDIKILEELMYVGEKLGLDISNLSNIINKIKTCNI